MHVICALCASPLMSFCDSFIMFMIIETILAQSMSLYRLVINVIQSNNNNMNSDIVAFSDTLNINGMNFAIIY